MAVILEMSVDRFIELADNPRQRNTESHARKATRKHLKNYSPTHDMVAVATVGGVPVCKLDGHTRAYLWKNGKLKRPERAIAVAYEVCDLKEAAELYTNFDNCDAVEGSKDRMSGAAKESKLVLSSGLLRNHDFATALKFSDKPRGASSGATEYALMEKWLEPIKKVDSLGLSKNRFKGSGLLSLMLILFASRMYRDETIGEFFVKYEKDEGIKDGKRMDGVQALDKHMEHRRANRLMTGYENILDQMCYGLSCFTAWTKNAMIVNVQSSDELLKKVHAQALSNLSKGE